MYKKINTLIGRALLLGLCASFFISATAHAAAMSDNFRPVIYIPPASSSIQTVTPTPIPTQTPAPQVVAEAPPPVSNEYILQKAARN